jgi:serine/threonine protein phosphatase 1
MRSYAIGDIHGHIDLLRAAHARIAADRRDVGDTDAPIVHLGDLVDRGPASNEVVEYLRRGPTGGDRWVTIRGNHDSMFARFMADPTSRDPGLRSDLTYLDRRIGGATTLRSYGVRDPETRPVPDVHADALYLVPITHAPWMATLPLTFAYDTNLFVHAGLRPGIPLAQQTETDLMWIRAPFHIDPMDHGALIVHGHTPVDHPTHYGNRLNVDTGAAYGGPLTAVVIEGTAVFQLTDIGRVPVMPLHQS